MELIYSDIEGTTVPAFDPSDYITFSIGFSANQFRLVETVNGVELRRGSTITTILGATLADFADDGTENPSLRFDDGSVYAVGGAGDDTLTGSSLNDVLDNLAAGGADSVNADGGNDRVIAGNGLSADDTVDGGSGSDTLVFEGVMAGLVSFNSTTVTNVEQFQASAGSQVRVALADATVSSIASSFFSYVASSQTQSDLSYVDGSAVTSKDLRLTGGAGDDTLIGGDLDDSLTGGDGNDSLGGNGGVDTLVGGLGQDTLTGGSGDDLFIFNFATPRSESSPNIADTITDFEGRGTAGGDLIQLPQFSGSLPLVFNGTEVLFDFTPGVPSGEQLAPEFIGDGFADVSWRNFGSGHRIWVDADDDGQFSEADILIELTGVGDGATSIAISDFANTFPVIRLTQGPDVFPDVAGGNAGADVIFALGGNDSINAGASNDEVHAGGGIDTVDGGDGRDSIFGDGGADSLIAGAGDSDFISGGDGNDTIEGISGNNQSLRGDDGDDSILGGTGTDFISGGNDNDSLFGGGANDSINGDSGNDTIDGGTGNDRLNGGAGNDSLFGNDGLDTLFGSAGLDTTTGGSGSDKFSFNLFSSVAPTAAVPTTITDFTIADGDVIEFTNLSPVRPLVLRDPVDFDPAFGGAIGDTLGGSDLGTGFWQVWRWQNGADTEVYIDWNDNRVLDSTDIKIVLQGITATDIDLSYFAPGNFTVQVGTPLGDSLTGSSGSDTIFGVGGDDTIEGNGGVDSLVGGDGNDSIIGGTSNDQIRGDDGNDTLIGGGGQDGINGGLGDDLIDLSGGSGSGNGSGGNDSIIGGALSDTLDGGGENDTLEGNGGADNLRGSSGNDSLFGGDGNDILTPGTGDDSSDGGLGDDRYSFSSGFDTFTGGTGADTIQGSVLFSQDTAQQPQVQSFTTVTDFNVADGDVLQFFNGIRFGREPFVFIGAIDTGAHPGFTGMAGDALPDPGLGTGFTQFHTWDDGNGIWLYVDSNDNRILDANDFAMFFEGLTTLDETAFVNGTFTVLVGSSVDDTLIGTTGNDTIYGVGGNDSIEGLDGSDSLIGGDGSDTIQSGDGLDNVSGNDGDDSIFGGNDRDFLDGGAGNDTIFAVGGSSNSLSGRDGNDSLVGGALIDNMFGGNDQDTLEGGAGNDNLNGDNGDDSLFGEDGNDRLNGGNGNDSLDGGADNDTLTGSGGLDTMTGGTGIDTFSFVVSFSSPTIAQPKWSAPTLIADYTRAHGDIIDLFNNIGGLRPPFVLRDTLAPGFTNTVGDTLGGSDLGTGFTQFFTYFDGAETWFIGDTNDNRILDADDFTIKFAGDLSDLNATDFAPEDFAVIVGTENNDSLSGDGANDTIYGVAGDDTIEGFGGVDSILGGDGADSIDGGDAADRLNGDAGNDSILGGAGNDIINAGEGDDSVEGGLDADNINGLAGNDTLLGGFGNDNISGGNDDDSINGGSDNDILNGDNGNDRIDGEDGADRIRDGAGDDTVDGGAGRDTITSGSGADIFTLGTGADTFEASLFFSGALNQASTFANPDIITDFKRSEGDEISFFSQIGVPTWDIQFRGEVSAGFTGIGSGFGIPDLGANIVELFTWTVSPTQTWLIADTNGNHVADADDYALLFTGGLEEPLERNDFDGLTNVAPFARDDTIQIAASNAYSENLQRDWGSGIDFDPEGNQPRIDRLFITIAGVEQEVVIAANTTVTLDSGASLTVGPDGFFQYDPDGAYDFLGTGESALETVRYRITDDDDEDPKTSEATVTFEILSSEQNITPVFRDTNFSALENIPVGTVIGTAEASDANGGTDLRYSIIGGNTGNAFDIVATTGEIIVQNPSLLDFETNPFFFLDVEVRDQDGLGATDTAVITVRLLDKNEAPVFADESLSLDENSSNGTTLSITGAIDPDTQPPFDTLTYSILSGNESGAFSIDSQTGEISVADSSQLDFEATSTFVLDIEAADGGTSPLSDSAAITINLNDLNDTAPEADLNGAEPGLDESASYTGGVLTVISNMVVSDPDLGGAGPIAEATLRFTPLDDSAEEVLNLITTGTPITFSVISDPTEVIVQLSGPASVDEFQQVLRTLTYENTSASPTPGDRMISITLSDGSNFGAASTVTVNIAAPNLPPALTTNVGGTLDEGSSLSIDDTLLAGADPDGDDAALIYTLSRLPSNGTLFLGVTELVLSDSFTQADIAAGSLSFIHDGGETTSDSFGFTLSDSENTLPEADFTFSINPVNDAPDFGPTVEVSLAEGGAALLSAINVPATDVDDDDTTLIYEVTAVPLNGSLENGGIALGVGDTFSPTDLALGQVSYVHDGSDTTADTIGLVVRDPSGALSAPADLTVNVTPVQDAPTIVTPAAQTVLENQIGILVDIDAIDNIDSEGAGLSYSFSGDDAANFLIDAATGEITWNANNPFDLGPNHEAPRDLDGDNIYELDVTATDTDGLSDVLSLSITVQDVPEAPELVTAVPPPGGFIVPEGRTELLEFFVRDDDDTLATGINVGISGGADAALFDVVQTQPDAVRIVLLSPLDFESPTDADGDNFYEVELTATDTDGLSDTYFYSFNLVNVNEAPELGPTSALAVDEGATVMIGSLNLPATDVDDDDLTLIYEVTATPANGTLNLGGLVLGVGGTFSAMQLASGDVTYSHDGSETTLDSVSLLARDPGGETSPIQDLEINVVSVNDTPVLQRLFENNLTNEGDSTFINASTIEVTDADNSPEEIVFTILSLPGFGELTVDGNPLGLGDTFTQADVNAGTLVYTHDGSENFNDGFDVEASDGLETISIPSYVLNISPVDDAPEVIVNTGLSVTELGPANIDTALLNALDPDTAPADVLFSITSIPVSGVILKDGLPVLLGEAFSLVDLQSGLVQYSLADASITSDSFEFALTDGTTTLTAETFEITVNAENADPVIDPDGTSDLTGSVTERPEGAPDEGTAILTSTGIVAISDINLSDTHTASFLPLSGSIGTIAVTTQPTTTNATTTGMLEWTFTASDADLEFLAAGEAIVQSYTLLVEDGQGGSATTTVDITLEGNGDTVVPSFNTFGLEAFELPDGDPFEGSNFRISSGTSFTDLDIADTHTIGTTRTSADLGGTLTAFLNPDSTGTGTGSLAFFYDSTDANLDFLAEGQTETESFEITVTGPDGLGETFFLDFNLNGANDAPELSTVNDFFTTSIFEGEDGSIFEGRDIRISSGVAIFDVDLTDTHTVSVERTSDDYGGTLTASILDTAPLDGIFSLQWQYQTNDTALDWLAEGQIVTESFLLTVSDIGGLTETYTVNLNLTGANDAPEMQSEIFVSTVSEDEFTGIALPTYFTLNDRADDPDSDDDASTLTYEVISTPTLGTSTITPTGITFEPGSDFQFLDDGESQTVEFEVQARDGHNAMSNTSTLTFEVLGANDAPELAVREILILDEGAGAAIDASLLEVSDADDTPDEIVFRVTSVPLNGTLLLSGIALALDDTFTQADINAGLLSYLHDGSDTTGDNFVFQVSDGTAQQLFVFPIQINAIDDTPPVVDLNGADETGVDRSQLFDGVALSLADIDAFTDDPGVDDTLIEMRITLSGALDGNDEGILFDTTGTGLSGSVALDGAIVISGPANPSAYDMVLASLRYDNMSSSPSGGDRTVVITVTDLAGNISTPAIATVTVPMANQPPVANDTALAINEDNILSGGFPFFSDPDNGDIATITAINGDPGAVGGTVLSSGATLFLSGDSSLANIIYDPRTALNGLKEGENFLEVITYTVTDTDGLTDTGTLTIEVAGVNDQPVAADDVATVFEDGTTLNLWSDLLGNDIDPDGDALSIQSIDSTATVGSVLFDDSTQSIHYVADADILDGLNPGESFLTSFEYTIADSFGGQSTAAVEITVFGVDEPNNGGNQTGGGGDNVLQGDDTANSLRGGGGNDTLIGGGGDDKLNGGMGEDYFVFAPGFGQDEISGYEPGIDKIDAAAALGLADASEVYDYFDSNGDGIIDGRDDEAFVQRGRLNLEFDGDGIDGNAEDSITLKSISFLTSDDFGDAIV